jgi:hypothetical protein
MRKELRVIFAPSAPFCGWFTATTEGFEMNSKPVQKLLCESLRFPCVFAFGS